MLSGPVRQEAREQRLPVGGVTRWAEMAAPWPSPHIQAWAGAAHGAGVLGLKRGPPRRRCRSPALPVARPLAKGDLAHAPWPGPRLSSRVPVSAPGPFSLLPERGALSHLRLPARPPRSARPAAGPDPPFRSRHTNVAPQGGNAASCHVSHTAHAVAHLSLPEIILLVSLCPRGGGGAGRYRSLASNAAPSVPRTRQGVWRCPVTLCRMHERIVGRLETFGR